MSKKLEELLKQLLRLHPKYIDLLVEEINVQKLEGNEFDLAKSVYAQLPFFSCRNKIKDNGSQKDIERYLYCQQFNIPPYDGGYGEQPARWVRDSFIIRKALAKREREQIDAEQRRNNN